MVAARLCPLVSSKQLPCALLFTRSCHSFFGTFLCLAWQLATAEAGASTETRRACLHLGAHISHQPLGFFLTGTVAESEVLACLDDGQSAQRGQAGVRPMVLDRIDRPMAVIVNSSK